MPLRCEPLGQGGAKIIYPEDDLDLERLALEEIRELFRSAGVLLFRGFGADAWRMKCFAEQLSSRFNRDQSRSAVDGCGGLVYLVTEGMGYVEPHSEQANSPFRPDAIWFCCVTPAAKGGETLFWDGVRVWEEFSPALKRLFTSKKLRFFQRYPAERWKQFLGEGSTLEDAQRLLDAAPGASYHLAPDQSIYLEYVCSAVVQTKYGGYPAFANSLLLEHRTLKRRFSSSANHAEGESLAAQLMSFNDGSSIPESVIEEVTEVIASLTEEIRWQAGDLVMIDNSRFLHGRNAFQDARRQLYSSCSFLNF